MTDITNYGIIYIFECFDVDENQVINDYRYSNKQL